MDTAPQPPQPSDSIRKAGNRMELDSSNQNSRSSEAPNTISQQDFEVMRQRYADELLAIRRSVDKMLGRTVQEPAVQQTIAPLSEAAEMSSAASAPPVPQPSVFPLATENSEQPVSMEAPGAEPMGSSAPVPEPAEYRGDNTSDNLRGDTDEGVQNPEDEETLAPAGAKPAPLTDEATLQVLVTAAQQAIPVTDALVLLSRQDPGQQLETLIRVMGTDESGQTPVVTLPAPDRELAQAPGEYLPYTTYRVVVTAEGYRPQFHGNVAVFGGMSTLLPVALVPLMEPQVPPPSSIGANYTAL